MNELRLDGDIAAGILGKILSVEVTNEGYVCGGCGRLGTLGAAMVCAVRELGTNVLRPSCDDALVCHEHPSNAGA